MRNLGWVLVMASASACVLDDKNVGIESNSQSGGGSSSGESGGSSDGSSDDAATTSSDATSSVDSGPPESSSDDTAGEESTTDGCSDPDGCPPPMNGFEENLDTVGGCRNILVFATDNDQYVLEVSTLDKADLIGLAEAAGQPIEIDMEIGTEDVNARVIYGDNADAIPCNDAVPPDLELTYLIGYEGDVHFRVDPPDENGNALVDVTLTNASFQHIKGGPVLTVDEYTWTDVTVGWLPG